VDDDHVMTMVEMVVAVMDDDHRVGAGDGNDGGE
jgi:hypothetical protein